MLQTTYIFTLAFIWQLGLIEVGSVGMLYLHVTYIHLRSSGIYKINIKKKYIYIYILQACREHRDN